MVVVIRVVVRMIRYVVQSVAYHSLHGKFSDCSGIGENRSDIQDNEASLSVSLKKTLLGEG